MDRRKHPGHRPLGNLAGVAAELNRHLDPATPIGLLVALGEQKLAKLSGLSPRLLSPLLAELRGLVPGLYGGLEPKHFALPAPLGCLPPRMVAGASMDSRPVRSLRSNLPVAVSLLPDTAPELMRSQGGRGTCVAFATLNALEARCRRLRAARLRSPQFLYHECKEVDGVSGQGTRIEVALEVLSAKGVCEEATLPYDPRPQGEASGGPRPPELAYEEAREFVSPQVWLLESGSVNEIKEALAAGFVVVVGIPVYESWVNSYTHLTGRVPNRLGADDGLLGYHAVALMAYDDRTGLFGFKNSWTSIENGSPVGWAVESAIAPGYGTISYSYVESSGHGQAIVEAPAMSRVTQMASRCLSMVERVVQVSVQITVPLGATAILLGIGGGSLKERPSQVESSAKSATSAEAVRRVETVAGNLPKGVEQHLRHALEVSRVLEELPDGAAKRRALKRLASEVQAELQQVYAGVSPGEGGDKSSHE